MRSLVDGFVSMSAPRNPPTAFSADRGRLHRDFDMDKYDCTSSAEARATLAHPYNDLASLINRSYRQRAIFLDCLHSRGWREVA
jgi:hypothetical protein